MKPLLRSALAASLALAIVSLPTLAAPAWRERADQFLALVNAGYQALYRVESEAQWLAGTDVTAVHDAGAETAGKARAAFNGNPFIIREARELLSHRQELSELQIRQLDRCLLNAAEGPMTNPDLVNARVTAETAQNSTLNGFQFRLDGTNCVANDLDRVLTQSTKLKDRQAAWEASKMTGPALKSGLVKLRDLRNRCATELGHSNYFALQVASYDLTAAEMLKLNDNFLRELRPLHSWDQRLLIQWAGIRLGTGWPYFLAN